MRLDKENVKGMVAVDKKTGDRYAIGTTKVFHSDGSLKIEYTYYTFRISNFDMSRFTGFMFEVARSREVIGNQDSMYLEIAEGQP